MPKISTYPAAGALTGTERVLLNQDGVTKTAAASAFLSETPSAGLVIVNVTDYGATGDGTTDDWAACQAAHDAILATGNAGVLYFPPGTYALSQPLHLSVPGLRVLGAGRWDTTTIKGIPAVGNYPLLYARVTPSGTWPLGPALVTGDGGALAVGAAHASAPFINWCESSILLNGLTAFTAECFINLTTLDDGDILSSTGVLVQGDAADEAFNLYLGSQKLLARITTTGTAHAALTGTTTLSTDMVYHCELSWDGTTARLFLNGNLEASTALAGTLVQAPHEFGNIGEQRHSFAIGSIYTAIEGSIDSVRLSSTARHTSAFTAPTAKLTFDASTKFLQNFDDDDADFARCMHRNIFGEAVPVWLPKYAASAYLNYIEVGHLGLAPRTGQGLWLAYSWQTYLHDLYVLGGAIAINCAVDQFNSTFERIELVDNLGAPGGRYGFLGQFNIGETFTAFSLSGYHYQFALLGAGSGTLSNFYTHGDADLPIVLCGNTGGNVFQLIGMLCSNEDVSVAQRCLVLFNGCPSVTVLGGNFEAWSSAKPVFVFSGGYSAVLIGPSVRMHTDADEVIEIAVALENEVRLIGGTNHDFPAIPWSLTTITEL